METRANYVLVGAFTLAVIAAAFGFVYWFSTIGQGGTRAFYRVAFDGSVSGLRTGGSVLFNGIKVGEVTDLKLNPSDPRQVVATIATDEKIPVRADTRVGLDFQGLTGIAAVSLKGGSLDAPLVTGKGGEPPLLIADPSSTQDAIQAARDVLRRLDAFFAENEGALKSAVQNIDTFSGTLARNSQRLDGIMAGLEQFTGGGVEGKGELSEAVRAMKDLAENLDKRTAEISAGLVKFTGSGLKQWEALAVDGRRTLSVVERAVRNFDRNPQRVIFGGSASESEPTAPARNGGRR